MKLDAALLTTDLNAIPKMATEFEDIGIDAIFSFEGPHDPFFPLLVAADHTKRVGLGTAVAIAFARNPMITAQIANDLHQYSGGRFFLGLGPQIKPHIERRFSSEWSKPVSRMREFVLALRAIWSCWNDGDKLHFDGEFYTHTLMPPLFCPAANPHGRPPVFLAGVGPKMTRVAGEVADGLLVHPLNTPKFIDTVTVPSIEEGLAKSELKREDFSLACQALVVTGEDEESYKTAYETVRGQIGFYGSTPAYKVVLDTEGWGDLQPELREMTKEGRWQDLPTLVSDEMVETIATCGPPDVVGSKLVERYRGTAERVAVASPYRISIGAMAELASAFKAAQ